MSKMKNIINKSIKTVKSEGPISFVKKSYNYTKYHLQKDRKLAYSDILIVNGCTLPHPRRYRVDHQLEQLIASNLHTETVFYENLNLDLLKYYRGFIFYRCPITPTIKDFITKAKQENKTVFFDVDDLVIDTKYTDNIEFIKNMSKEEKEIYDSGVNRIKETMLMCDYAITTTEKLAKELKNYVSDVYINRNVASERMAELSIEAINNKKEKNEIMLGYLSGSITHNPDVELIKPTLIKLLKKYDNLRLMLAGEIDLPKDLIPFKDKIIIEPFVNWEKLPELISNLDINLAPLEESIFNEAKSENKWMEAALCKVVTVASNTGAFKDMINHQIDGILCEKEKDWEEELIQLIEDKNYRQKIANNAFNRVIKSNITTYTGHGLKEFILSKLNRNIAFVIPTSNISGGINVILKHIDILKKQGYDVFAINMDKSNKDIVNELGIIRVLSNDKIKFKGHINTLVATLWTTLNFVKKAPNTKNKMYLVQSFETDFAEYGKFMKIEANSTYEDITGIKYITISKWCQKWLKEKYEKEAKYAPNGLNLDLFKAVEREYKGKIKILIEGNSTDYYKNTDESFKIVEKLDKEKYEISYLSYGGEPKKWYYVDKFLHKVPYKEVSKYYQNADVLLKTSILESFSYPPLEMMSTKGLVLVAPNDGNIEFVKDEENCLFYEPGNIDHAVTQLERFRTDKKLREKIMINGIKTAQSREWDKIENEIINLYKED